ncbi:hypothetical protein [Leptotrichia massiliensis]|uniref:hypothetical protein n=1 Tax=Leptotrichia massiliensis TaxID=1852388 RepID=UPI0028D7BB7F|nr:hypothetical protein [Leptotrichia massiliensis]
MSENDIIIVDNVVELESLNKNDKIIIEDMTGRNKDDLIKYIKNEDKFLELLYQLDEKEDMEKLLKMRLISGEDIPLNKIFLWNIENINKFQDITINCLNNIGEQIKDGDNKVCKISIYKISRMIKGRSKIEKENIKFELNKEEGILYTVVNNYDSILSGSFFGNRGGFIRIPVEDNPKFINLIVDIVYDKNERSKKARSYFEL